MASYTRLLAGGFTVFRAKKCHFFSFFFDSPRLQARGQKKSGTPHGLMGPNRGTLVGVPRERIGCGKGRVCFFTLVAGPERRENRG